MRFCPNCQKVYDIEEEICPKCGSPLEEPPEELPRGKRIAIRILSMVLFIALVALVIFGTDSIIAFVKQLL